MSLRKKGVAFVNTEKSLDWVFLKAFENQIESLLVISENELSFKKTEQPFDIDVKNISEFRTVDLDKTVLKNLNGCYSSWLSKDKKLLTLIQNYRIDDAVRFGYASVIFQLFRRLTIFSDVIEAENPEIIITDAFWDRLYSKNFSLSYKPIHISAKDISYPVQAIGLTASRWIKIIRCVIVSLFGGILFPILIGKVINIMSGKLPKDCSILLVGDRNSIKSFRPVWEKINTYYPKRIELKIGNAKPSEIKKSFKDRIRWVDGFVRLREIPMLLIDYGKLCSAFIKKNGSLPLPNQEAYEMPIVSFSSEFETDLDFFFIRSFARTLCYRRINSITVNHQNLKNVIFTVCSPATTSLSGLLREKGVNTTSTTHGMVLEPIAYCSNDTQKITWSKFDANLLRDYSKDDKLIGLPINPEGYKNKNFERNSNLLPLQNPTYIFPKKLAKKKFETISGNCTVIFPSTNQHGKNLKRFLEISLSHLIEKQNLYGFDYILIKPKNHRRTNLEEFYSMIDGVVPKNFNYPIILNCKCDITNLLRKSIFSICAHSSIMLDCLRMGVPFTVYLHGTLSDREFVSYFPQWMRFQTQEDLERINTEVLRNFDQDCDILKKLYWGDVDNIDCIPEFVCCG